MLSVLIPIYNHDVSKLVTELDQQLAKAGIIYEIILLDDCSSSKHQSSNSSLKALSKVEYKENETNLGRAKIRNRLAKMAQYTYLLFIDCDATIPDRNYIRNYIEAIRKYEGLQQLVINGGVAYRKEQPAADFRLRWYYGRKREQVPAERRSLHPYHHFTPFNVVLSKSIFDSIQFDESLTTYGNEDTLFGIHLSQHKTPYYHIDNPLYHDGLDHNESFLEKIRISIDNLEILIKNQVNNDFIQDNRLLKTYFRCKRMALQPILAQIYQKCHLKMCQKLCKSPNMALLDLYKLSYISTKKL